jgi:hypothetical protein
MPGVVSFPPDHPRLQPLGRQIPIAGQALTRLPAGSFFGGFRTPALGSAARFNDRPASETLLVSGPSLWCGRTHLRIMVGLLYMEDGRAKILDFPLLNGGEFAIVYRFMSIWGSRVAVNGASIDSCALIWIRRIAGPGRSNSYRARKPRKRRLSRSLPSPPHELPAYMGRATRNSCGIKADFASHRLHA